MLAQALMWLPTSDHCRTLIELACLAVTVQQRSIPSVIAELEQRLAGILNELPDGKRAQVTSDYWQAIGFEAPYSPPPGFSQSESSNHSVSPGVIAVAVVVPTVVVAVIAAVWLSKLAGTRRQQHKNFWGKSKAPSGPGTTLAITDIQDSTALWDVLEASIMDRALELHHQVG